jgi:hypothetical protein
MAGSLFERLRPSSIEATPIESAPSAEEAPAAVSLLEKLDAERPLPIVELRELSPLERLQEWLDRRWRKSTISAFEIYTYGPHADRNKQTALELAGKLVQQGCWCLSEPAGTTHENGKLFGKASVPRPRLLTPNCSHQPQPAKIAKIQAKTQLQPQPQPPTAANYSQITAPASRCFLWGLYAFSQLQQS